MLLELLGKGDYVCIATLMEAAAKRGDVAHVLGREGVREQVDLVPDFVKGGLQ